MKEQPFNGLYPGQPGRYGARTFTDSRPIFVVIIQCLINFIFCGP